jgi:hypothetical protein
MKVCNNLHLVYMKRNRRKVELLIAIDWLSELGLKLMHTSVIGIKRAFPINLR